MAPRRPLTQHAPAVLLAKLASGDPETRWLAAKDLDRHGDRSTLGPLEGVALRDDDSFQREGGYVDTTEHPATAAFAALTSIYERHPPSPEDITRVRAWLADPGVEPARAEHLGTTLGAAALEMAAPLLHHADPTIRLRATNVTARAQRARANHALWVDDEEVRLAATQQDAYRPRLVLDALERFPDEPSPRVRRGLSDLWLRYRARMGGWLRSFELADQLVDPDPAIHARVAQHVLDTARRRTTTWIDDPGGLHPVRARLAALLAAGGPPPPAAVLREVLALIDAALAPFRDPAAVPGPPAPAATAPAPAATTPTPAATTPAPAPAPARAGEEGWSVLAAADLAAEVRARLDTLGRERRAALARSIGTAVIRELATMIYPWFSAGSQDHARVDVFSARPRGDALVLQFVADHDNYNFAQSGSDWDDHYVFAGEAELAGGVLGTPTFALERHVHLTEHQHEDYDARQTRDLVRDDLRARRGGAAPDPAPVDAEVARVRAASVARARAHTERAAARAAQAAPPAPPPRTARCPTCASGEVGCELLFDAYQLGCQRCGHKEIIETYPEPDSDEHWYA